MSKDAKSLRALALSGKDREAVAVEVPEWGGETFFVKAMSLADQNAMYGADDKPVEGADRTALVLALSVYDADGSKVFEPADAADLLQASSAAVNRLAKVIRKLNGFDETADEKKG